MEQITQHDVAGPVAGHYSAGEVLGAPFKVYLANGVEEEPGVGEPRTSITDLPGLIGAIVQARALHPRKLTGADLKFIRTGLRMRSKDLAEFLSLTPEHYSRCESGDKTLSPTAEKAYRVFAILSAALRDERLIKALPKTLTQEQLGKALEGFRQVFADIKIEVVEDAVQKEDLAFVFSRRPRNHDFCSGAEDGEWEKVEQKQAA